MTSKTAKLVWTCPVGQDYYQTYARTRVERGFFPCPFLRQTQENKQKMAGNGLFFLSRRHPKFVLVGVVKVTSNTWSPKQCLQTKPRAIIVKLLRSAPKGRQQMGETGFCKNLRFSAVSCENLRFPAVFCANLRFPKSLDLQSEPKISENLQKSAKMCVPGPVSPFCCLPFSAPWLLMIVKPNPKDPSVLKMLRR